MFINIKLIMRKQLFACAMLFVFLVFLPQSIFSVPAYPHFITVKQPNGEEITLKMRGDERMKWMESEDGYSLMYDSDKNIVFAALDENEDMVPSAIRASDYAKRSPEVKAKLKNIPKGLQYSKNQKQIFRQVWKMRENSLFRSLKSSQATTKAKAICALIGFPDKPITKSLSEFELLMNQIGYSAGSARGSVRDFYLENSYGQLDLIVTVVGPYVAANDWAYYGENDATGNDAHAVDLAREAANFAFNEANIDPADYDNDGDGYIDAFHFLYAGYGEESGADSDCIWAHMWGFSRPLIFGDVRLDVYSCSPELRGSRGSSITSIGPICHELCHIFGAPDFYDADGPESGGDFLGTGDWDLMASGSWNGNGDSPAHINMYQKIDFGWVNPIELNSTQTITDMPNSALNPVAYTIQTPTPGEYYVLENRQQEGFDRNVPGTGLLIYHVSGITRQSLEWNEINTGHPQKVYPVYASSSLELPTGSPNSYGAINSSRCTFNTNRNSFSSSTIPSMFTWERVVVSKPITQIKEINGLISFQFMSISINLTASIEGNQITLNWTAPDSNREIKGYNIYRNDQFIGFINQPIFKEIVRESGIHSYSVAIKYGDDSESDRETVDVEVILTSMDWVEKTPALIYPNPIEQGSILFLNMGEYAEKADLFFYNVSGQLVLHTQTSLSISQHTINLPRGMYILKLKKGSETEVFKLKIN